MYVPRGIICSVNVIRLSSELVYVCTEVVVVCVCVCMYRFEVLDQVCSCGEVLGKIVSEVERRQTFNKLFTEVLLL